MPGALGSREPGYVLKVDPDRVDARRFEMHVTAGCEALGGADPARAEGELERALALWRGEALADCQTSEWAAAEALRLEELRLSAIENRVAAGLMLGRHGALVGEIESLVAGFPFRERLWGALIVALYRSGRQADALRAYQRGVDLLVGELGPGEPGAELRRLEAAVLAGDQELDYRNR